MEWAEESCGLLRQDRPSCWLILVMQVLFCRLWLVEYADPRIMGETSSFGCGIDFRDS